MIRFKQYLKEAQAPFNTRSMIFVNYESPALILSSTMIDRIFGQTKVDAWHVTDLDGLKGLKRIEGKKSSISVLTDIEPGRVKIFTKGVETGGGYCVSLEGSLLVSADFDIYSERLEGGRRAIAIESETYPNLYKDMIKMQDKMWNKYGEKGKLDAGQDFNKLGNSLKAKPLFEKLVEMGDTDATVLHFLSSIYLEQSKLDSAIVIAYRLMDHFPSDPRGYLDAAMVELNRENPSGAIDILNPVSEKFQKEFSIQYLLGSSYQQLEEYDKATKLLRRSLTIYPDSRGARHTLAIASDAMRHWSESDSLYEGLIASDTNDVQALNNYSYSLVERNIQLKKSLEMSKKAIDMEPDNAAYLDTIGWIYFKLNNAQKALYYIRRSIELEGENAVVLEHLGDVLIATDQTEEARTIYLRALEIDKDNELLKQKAGVISD